MPNLLGPLGNFVKWLHEDIPEPDTDIGRLFEWQGSIHKFSHYIPIYEELFHRYRHKPITMIEIGVGAGGSLQLWRNYFTKARIIGLDHRPECKRYDDPPNNVHVRIGKQEDRQFLREVIDELGPFHIVLDDGSHQPAKTRTTFETLFTCGLADGGVYVVEDLSHCYFPTSNDGTPPFTEVLKKLIDTMHNHYRILQSVEAFEGDEPPKLAVPLATTLVGSIQVWDGIAAIRRQPHSIPHCVFRPT